MVHYRVKITGIDAGFVKRQIDSLYKLSAIQIERLARETETLIRQKITERIERAGSEGNLANSFFAVQLGEASWGVGDIEYLNQNAPYWYWQNFGVAQSGRKTPPRSRGQFAPGVPQPTAGQSGARWYQSSSGGFLINPTKPIKAKNYIDATLAEVNILIKSVLGKGKI